MVVLVVDGSNSNLSISCFEKDALLATVNLECQRNLSEIILNEIDNCLKEANRSLYDLTEIVSTRGPGSYTALRVVLAIAKTFSYSLNITISTISSLKLLASNVSNKDDVIVSFIDGRRGNAYASIYLNGEEILKEDYYNFDEIIDYVNNRKENVVFISNDTKNFNYDRVKNNYVLINKNIDTSNYLLVENIRETTDCFNAKPSYLRLTEAERSLIENDKDK